jgi:hypothetical protein
MRWSPCGDVKVESKFKGRAVDVSAASVRGELHVVVVTDKGELFYTVRHPTNREWTPAAAVPGEPGKARRCSATAYMRQLHVGCVDEKHRVWHAIYRIDDAFWTPFADVQGQSGERGRIEDVALANVFHPD